MSILKDAVVIEKPGLAGFFQAVPRLIKNVWSGAWLIFVFTTFAVYLSDPGLQFLTLDEWLTSHILIVLSLLALTVAFYNFLGRLTAALMTMTVWFFAAGLCYFAEATMRVAAH